jgi:hypothetical protein
MLIVLPLTLKLYAPVPNAYKVPSSHKADRHTLAG